MRDGEWKIESPNATATGDAKRLPFVAAIKIAKDMEEGQKNFAELFNEMRSTLIANNLMDSK